MPKVSIIMNCFNGERYLREAIDSIYAQTFPDWEIIFFDNNSSDRSAEIAGSYDGKLKYFLNKNTIPLGAARRKAVEMAKGEWIAFLDTDDIWYRDNLKTQLASIDGTDYCLSYGGVCEITSNGGFIRDFLPQHKSGDIFPNLLNQFDINMVTPILKSCFLKRHNLNFDPIITASEEYNLFMRVAAKGSICVHNKVLGKYRVSNNSLTNKSISKWAFERNYTLNQICLENPDIEKIYPLAFKEARARARYYQARYEMSEGRKQKAIDNMNQVKRNNVKYFILWIISYSRNLWDIIHDVKIKRLLSRVLSI